VAKSIKEIIMDQNKMIKKENSEATSHPIRVLLIDDQMIIVEGIKKILGTEGDIEFFYCTDGRKAIETALRVAPTVILQDLIMPEVEGMNIVRFFRAHPKTRDVPLVILSSKEDPIVKAQGFALGANDYLVKIPDPVELIARIRYHSKSYGYLQERNAAHQLILDELQEAESYVKALLPPPLTQGSCLTDSVFIPSTQLGGDAFGYQWLDEENLMIYLLDVCGHGVGAALLAVSALTPLTSRSLPGVNYHDPSAVLTKLNELFPMEKYFDRYFTMWYGVINFKKMTITYACGGHPPAVLVAKNKEPQSLKVPGFIIGGMSDSIYPVGEIAWSPGDKLYLFSDGAFELRVPGREMLSLQEFIALLGQYRNQDYDLPTIYRNLQQIQGDDHFEDDFTLVEFRLGPS
jgi:sigma-B regulation protein RsbU (phosphoserine phosphatase)